MHGAVGLLGRLNAMWVGPTLALTGYVLGSVCFGLVLAKRRGVDLRTTGSGNVGATNVARALGTGAGRTVMALDALKGFAPALAAHLLLGAESPWTAATGALATAGHIWPLFHRFRGGKGAATALGVLLAVVPPAGLVAAVTFVALKRVTRRASVGSLAGSVLGAATTVLVHGLGWPSRMAGVIVVLIVVRHLPNIRRLLRGEEPPS